MTGEPTITIIGTLGGDPELRFTPGGKAVASANVAVNSRKRNQDGSYSDDGTTWYRITVWGQMAENASECLRKGDRIIAHGYLRTRQYTTKDNETRTTGPEITVSNIGPDLMWAQVTVRRAERSQGQGNGTRADTRSRPQPQSGDDDPWAARPKPASAFAEEPPF